MKNNMMKKLLTLVLAGAMTLSLAACGAKDPQPDSGTDGKDDATLPAVFRRIKNPEADAGKPLFAGSHHPQIIVHPLIGPAAGTVVRSIFPCDA